MTPEGVRVATHDAARVKARLAHVYRQPLEVIESPWTRAEYDRADTFWQTAEHTGVLNRLERGITDAGFVTVRVGVTYVDEALAALLSDIPRELLSVDALVRPA